MPELPTASVPPAEPVGDVMLGLKIAVLVIVTFTVYVAMRGDLDEGLTAYLRAMTWDRLANCNEDLHVAAIVSLLAYFAGYLWSLSYFLKRVRLVIAFLVLFALGLFLPII